jgi:hypothetical protein
MFKDKLILHEGLYHNLLRLYEILKEISNTEGLVFNLQPGTWLRYFKTGSTAFGQLKIEGSRLKVLQFDKPFSTKYIINNVIVGLNMFSFNKTVVCLEFSKTSVFCALAQISGRKVDIIAVDSIEIDSGILEQGVIYDSPHLEQIVKNLITSVSKTYSKIDAAWIAVPDNKVLITKFDVSKDKKGIREDDLHKAIEEKFNYSASKLLLINRQIHELNSKAFFLCDAIRLEHINPFIKLFDSLSIPVESVFPTFQCIYEDLKGQFTVPTLLLYPSEKGFKFFLADSDGVHLESVWGHNVIELNENFDKAVYEIVKYAQQSKEVALGVKNISVIESSKYDAELVQSYLQKTRINFNWIPATGYEESGFNPVNILILKGLLKAAMSSDLNKGFLEPQLINESSDFKSNTAPVSNIRSLPFGSPSQQPTQSYGNTYTTPLTKNTIIKNEEQMDSRWNFKVILATLLLGAAIIGLLVYGGFQISKRINKDGNEEVAVTTPTPTPPVIITTTPTIEITPSETPTPTPTLVALTKNDVQVQVSNGNNTAGEASTVSGILTSNGFKTKKANNYSRRDVPSTSVTYKDQRAKALAEEIAQLISSRYPTAKALYDPASTEDIWVVLGAH